MRCDLSWHNTFCILTTYFATVCLLFTVPFITYQRLSSGTRIDGVRIDCSNQNATLFPTAIHKMKTTAFQTALSLSLRQPIPSQRICHSNTPLATATPLRRSTPPQTHTDTSPVVALQQYQEFLRNNAPSTAYSPAPVFVNAEGGLVCQWSPEISEDMSRRHEKGLSGLLAMAEYEQFLSTDAAKGVDATRPVYVDSDGGLVCKYP